MYFSKNNFWKYRKQEFFKSTYLSCTLQCLLNKILPVKIKCPCTLPLFKKEVKEVLIERSSRPEVFC